MPLAEMAALFNSLHIGVAPGLVSHGELSCSFPSRLSVELQRDTRNPVSCVVSSVGFWVRLSDRIFEHVLAVESGAKIFKSQDPNVNNIVCASTFYSESAQATLCLVHIFTLSSSPLSSLFSSL